MLIIIANICTGERRRYTRRTIKEVAKQCYDWNYAPDGKPIAMWGIILTQDKGYSTIDDLFQAVA